MKTALERHRLIESTCSRLASILAIPIACTCIVGCGSQLKVVPVSGVVKVNGKPVENLAISFTPILNEASPGPTSSGVTDTEGRYSLSTAGSHRISGAAPGKHRVTMNPIIPGIHQMRLDEGKQRLDQANRALPSTMRDGSITFQVPPGGTTEADFDFTR